MPDMEFTDDLSTFLQTPVFTLKKEIGYQMGRELQEQES